MASYKNLNPSTGAPGRKTYRGHAGSLSATSQVQMTNGPVTTVSFTIWDDQHPIRVTLTSAEIDNIAEFKERLNRKAVVLNDKRG